MKLIHWLLWPEPAMFQGSKKAGIENHCHGSLSYVFWLVPQVCILPCWAAGMPQVPER